MNKVQIADDRKSLNIGTSKALLTKTFWDSGMQKHILLSLRENTGMHRLAIMMALYEIARADFPNASLQFEQITIVNRINEEPNAFPRSYWGIEFMVPAYDEENNSAEIEMPPEYKNKVPQQMPVAGGW